MHSQGQGHLAGACALLSTKNFCCFYLSCGPAPPAPCNNRARARAMPSRRTQRCTGRRHRAAWTRPAGFCSRELTPMTPTRPAPRRCTQPRRTARMHVRACWWLRLVLRCRCGGEAWEAGGRPGWCCQAVQPWQGRPAGAGAHAGAAAMLSCRNVWQAAKAAQGRKPTLAGYWLVGLGEVLWPCAAAVCCSHRLPALQSHAI